MFLFCIHYSAISIAPLLAARHEDDPTKFIILGIVIVVMWAIQAIGKLSKPKPNPPKPKPPISAASSVPKVSPPTLSRPLAVVRQSAPRRTAGAMNLPPLSQLHQKNPVVRSAPPPLPGQEPVTQSPQLRVAELLFANQLITPAQATRMRAELQRKQAVRAAPAAQVRPAAAQSRQPAPRQVTAVRPPMTNAPATAPIPARSTIARWLAARTLRSQFILAEALQPPLALRSKSHLP